MSPINRKARSLLAEQYADIFQRSQEDYRVLLNCLRDDAIDVDEFTERAEELMDQLVKLKRIKMQLGRERDELIRLTGGGDGHMT